MLHMGAYFVATVSIELAITPRAAKNAAWRSRGNDLRCSPALGRQPSFAHVLSTRGSIIRKRALPAP